MDHDDPFNNNKKFLSNVEFQTRRTFYNEKVLMKKERENGTEAMMMADS